MPAGKPQSQQHQELLGLCIHLLKVKQQILTAKEIADTLLSIGYEPYGKAGGFVQIVYSALHYHAQKNPNGNVKFLGKNRFCLSTTEVPEDTELPTIKDNSHHTRKRVEKEEILKLSVEERMAELQKDKRRCFMCSYVTFENVNEITWERGSCGCAGSDKDFMFAKEHVCHMFHAASQAVMTSRTNRKRELIILTGGKIGS